MAVAGNEEEARPGQRRRAGLDGREETSAEDQVDADADGPELQGMRPGQVPPSSR